MGKHGEINIEPLLYFMLDCFDYKTVKKQKKHFVELSLKEKYLEEYSKRARKILYSTQTSGWYKIRDKLIRLEYIEKIDEPRQGTKHSYKVIKGQILKDIYEQMILLPEDYEELRKRYLKEINLINFKLYSHLCDNLMIYNKKISILEFIKKYDKIKYTLLINHFFSKEFKEYFFNHFKEYILSFYLDNLSKELKNKKEQKQINNETLTYENLIEGFSKSFIGTTQIMKDYKNFASVDKNNSQILHLIELIRFSQAFKHLENHSLVGFKLNIETFFKQFLEEKKLLRS